MHRPNYDELSLLIHRLGKSEWNKEKFYDQGQEMTFRWKKAYVKIRDIGILPMRLVLVWVNRPNIFNNKYFLRILLLLNIQNYNNMIKRFLKATLLPAVKSNGVSYRFCKVINT